MLSTVPGSNAVSIGTVIDQIPAIGELEDDALRECVAATWSEAVRRSPYTLQQTPQSPLMVDRALLLHVNEVNELAAHLIGVASRQFGLLVDRDVALATAILHDVDKPLIYRRTSGGIGYAEGTQLSDHGALGAALAAEMGVPDRIVEMIRTHSPFASTGLPGTPEGTIVHYADFIANDFACEVYGATPIHSSVRYVHK